MQIHAKYFEGVEVKKMSVLRFQFNITLLLSGTMSTVFKCMDLKTALENGMMLIVMQKQDSYVKHLFQTIFQLRLDLFNHTFLVL